MTGGGDAPLSPEAIAHLSAEIDAGYGIGPTDVERARALYPAAQTGGGDAPLTLVTCIRDSKRLIYPESCDECVHANRCLARMPEGGGDAGERDVTRQAIWAYYGYHVDQNDIDPDSDEAASIERIVKEITMPQGTWRDGVYNSDGSLLPGMGGGDAGERARFDITAADIGRYVRRRSTGAVGLIVRDPGNGWLHPDLYYEWKVIRDELEYVTVLDAAAPRDAYREGAEAMRADAAMAVRSIQGMTTSKEIADAILALPIPGK